MYKFFAFLILLSLSIIAYSVYEHHEKLAKQDTAQDAASATVTDVKQFMVDMKNREEKEILVVKRFYGGRDFKEPNAPRLPEGRVVYYLKSRYDAGTNESWIDVQVDTKRFKQSQENPVEIMPSQQCGYISYDSENSKYLLTECFHRWSYELF